MDNSEYQLQQRLLDSLMELTSEIEMQCSIGSDKKFLPMLKKVITAKNLIKECEAKSKLPKEIDETILIDFSRFLITEQLIVNQEKLLKSREKYFKIWERKNNKVHITPKTDFVKLFQEFQNLNEQQQWEWAKKYKSDITLDLDNDNTTFTFDKEDKTDDCTLFMFKSDIGNRWGVPHLLFAIGFKGFNV